MPLVYVRTQHDPELCVPVTVCDFRLSAPRATGGGSTVALRGENGLLEVMRGAVERRVDSLFEDQREHLKTFEEAARL
jgi:hypothetical protein